MTKVIVFVILRTRLRNVLKLNRSCTVDCVSSTSSEKNRSINPSTVTCNSLARKGSVPLAYQFVVAVENILLESGAFYPQDFFLIGPICYLLVTTAGLAWLFYRLQFAFHAKEYGYTMLRVFLFQQVLLSRS
jgi:hypothetical protein